jgi:aspartate ammonia-lyase
VSLGGGVAGQPNATSEHYRAAIVAELRTATGLTELRLTANFADSAQNADDLLALAQDLDTLARVLIKQAKDLRLLASGPEGGLSEVILPALQPGSSAMPGKINPIVPEFVVQCAMYAIGAAAACAMATDHAELDLNVWEGIYVHNLLSAQSLLLGAIEAWNCRCLNGLQVDDAVNIAHAASLTSQLATVAQTRSYSAAQAELADRRSGPEKRS